MAETKNTLTRTLAKKLAKHPELAAALAILAVIAPAKVKPLPEPVP